MLREAQRVARVQVVVHTPQGFFPQHHQPGELDRWGLDGGEWQTHRSGWEVDDFGEDWSFVLSPDFILLDEHNQPLEQTRAALWAIRDLGEPRPRRYQFEESTWQWHTKRALERVLPRPVYNVIRRSWLRARSLLAEVRATRSSR